VGSCFLDVRAGAEGADTEYTWNMAALPDSPVVPVEEYLSTSYDPDVEFVDGALVERNMGDWLHSRVQTKIIVALSIKYPQLQVGTELRSKTANTRYRIPDVSVLLAPPSTDYLLDAAFLVVEVLSKCDIMSVVIAKLKEYDAKGVPNIWLVDPRLQLMWTYRPPALIEIEGDTIATADGSVELSRGEIFAE
jgi:Uma2 family endonuclease